MKVKFLPTSAQRKALSLVKGTAKHILLFGGSRSGKTTLLVMVLIYRAIQYPGSRHLICRLRLKDARSSVLHETLLPWLDRTIGSDRYSHVKHENYITIYNGAVRSGSEAWVTGNRSTGFLAMNTTPSISMRYPSTPTTPSPRPIPA